VSVAHFDEIEVTNHILSAQWGFHPGGWGKPPLDEYNRPLYGDVFGVLPKVTDTNVCAEMEMFIIIYLSLTLLFTDR
jgi:hypothetical protein